MSDTLRVPMDSGVEPSAPLSAQRRIHVARHFTSHATQGRTLHHGKPPWNFFAPQSASKITLSSASEGKSNHLLMLSKAIHRQPIASVKSDAALLWGTPKGVEATRAAMGTTPPPITATISAMRMVESSGASVSEVSFGHGVRVPNIDLMTAAERRRWTREMQIKRHHALLNEESLKKRRSADLSAATLDNPFRQLADPHNKQRPLMSAILSGAFMEPDRPLRPSSTDFVSANRQAVRSASAVVRECRSRGLFG